MMVSVRSQASAGPFWGNGGGTTLFARLASGRLRRLSALLALVALVSTLASPMSLAFAIPYEVGELGSSTHPDPATWYADDSPEFSWETSAVPEVVGAEDTPGRAYGVDFAGDYAYVASDPAGLTVVDISEVGTPTALGSVDTSGTWAWDVDVCGDYAFVASWDGGLHVVDVSEPGTPTVAGWTDTPDSARKVAVEGRYAYVADNTSLQVVDISDPTSPTVVGSIGGTARDVDVLGDVLYVARGTAGLWAYDISDPTSPAVLGSGGTGATSVFVDGGNALVTAGQSVDVLDVSDPSAPTVVGSVELETGSLASFSAADVAVSGDFAYVSCTGGGPVTDRDFQLLDISDVTDPKLIATADVSSNTYSVCAFDGHALLANDYDGLAVVEVWELGIPERIGTFDTAGGAYAVDVQGDLAYFADYGARLTIADISDPTAPTLVGTMNQNWAIYDIAVRGDVAYAAAAGGGLHVFDVSDPTAPEFLAGNDPGSSARGVDVQGDVACTANGGGGLWVFDVSTPSSPTTLGVVPMWDARKADLCGSLAYVANGTAGLAVVDVSEPSAPTVVGNEPLPDDPTAYDVAVEGDVAYIGSYDGVHAVDVSDPTDPSHLYSLELPNRVYGLDVAGDLVFAAAQASSPDTDTPGALYVVDVTDPSNLTLLETAETRRLAWDVAVAGDVAYVCNDYYDSDYYPASGLDCISWGGPVGYSYVLDPSDSAVPDDSADVSSATASFTGVADGEWWFTVKAVSRSGDVGPTVQRKVQIDANPPNVTSDAEASYDDSATIAISATDSASGVASVSYELDGGGTVTVAGASASVGPVTSLGLHTLTFWSEDNVGNESDPETMTFTVTDAVAPTVTSDAQPSYDDLAEIDVTATDAGTGVKSVSYRLDSESTQTVEAAGAATFTTTVTTSAEGEHTLTFLAEDEAGNVADSQMVTFTVVSTAPTTAERLAGATRYETAVKLSQQAFPDDGALSDIIVASGADYPDALSASGLAGAVGSPVLLVPASGNVPGAVKTEIARLADTDATVWVIGGTVAVSNTTANQLKVGAVDVVERIAGANRYDTAAKVAGKIEDIQGTAWTRTAFVASGANFPDALAASPVAYGQGLPVLLTDPAKLSGATKSALSSVDRAIIAGGPVAVSESVRTEIDALPTMDVERWSASDRYATAVKVAENAKGEGWADFGYVGVASGQNYPDALAGGPVAGQVGGVMVLTQAAKLPTATSSFLSSNAAAIKTVQVYGGTVAISNDVITAVNSALK